MFLAFNNKYLPYNKMQKARKREASCIARASGIPKHGRRRGTVPNMALFYLLIKFFIFFGSKY